MNRLLLTLLTSVTLLVSFACPDGLLAASPDVASALITYQFLEAIAEPPGQPNVVSSLVAYRYLESLAAPPAQPNIITPLVAYQYFEWPSGGNPTPNSSPPVSFRFDPVAIGHVSLSYSGTPPAPMITLSFPTDLGDSYLLKYKNVLTDPFWSVLRGFQGNGWPKTFVEEVNPSAPSKFYLLETLPNGVRPAAENQ